MTSQTPDDRALTLRFYQTLPHACSYLQEQEACTLFLDPNQAVTLSVYDQLTHLGFRRSGRHLYRPHCQRCNACQSVRIPVKDFQPDRQQKKIWKRNQDLSARVLPARFVAEHYLLYRRYIETRHADGDMYPPSESQYRSFLMIDQPWTRLVEFRDSQQRLLAVAAMDRLPQGLSAIYTFFCPDQARRSLGTYAILWQIQEAQQSARGHLYLGYWIAECSKMNYKSKFKPLEVLKQNRWQPMTDKPTKTP